MGGRGAERRTGVAAAVNKEGDRHEVKDSGSDQITKHAK
jgi:hypothetical protein